MRLSEDEIDVLAEAVFAEPPRQVLEAYSRFDENPRQFVSAEDLSRYIRGQLEAPRGDAFFFVTYPDMRGVAVKREIQLDRQRMPDHQARYTWDGWGLIGVRITASDAPSISANSEKRAMEWAATEPNWDPPSAWDWRAVQRHVRRLKRVLKAVA